MNTRKYGLLFLFLLVIAVTATAQTDPESALENTTGATDVVPEDDALLQEWEHLKRHPLQLNQAGAEELLNSGLFSAMQVNQLLRYRMLMGPLLHLHELLAVPGFDPPAIRQIRPYVKLAETASWQAETGKRLKEGEHELLFRTAVSWPLAPGYVKPDSLNGYTGSPQQLFFRYTYRFRNLLQYGLVGEKDAGEAFFRNPQKAGFDFYSFHLFVRGLKKISVLALGDYTINLGQGLIHWQRLAFGKSTELLHIKRQSPVLRPYHSAGEFNFLRGVAATLQVNHAALTVFISSRFTDANIAADSNGRRFVRSLLTGGYHRTAGELADRKQVIVQVAGLNVNRPFRKGHWAFNGVVHRFSVPVRKQEAPYNLYAWGGTNWANISMDYSMNQQGLHFFGETAMDKRGALATVNGLLFSPAPGADIALLYRRISPAYQAVNGNAFTENSQPVNESGFYGGISLRPAPRWKLDLYFDLFRFPWLRYLSDMPGNGQELVLQMSYTPDRETLLLTRFQQKQKTENLSALENPGAGVQQVMGKRWRTQFNTRLLPGLFSRNRIELVWYNPGSVDAGLGSLFYTDLIYKPLIKKWSLGGRIQYVETTAYSARVYAYENDVLYSQSVPVFSVRGWRLYMNVSWDMGRRLTCWIKWGLNASPSIYYQESVPDNTEGRSGGGVKVQLRYIFK